MSNKILNFTKPQDDHIINYVYSIIKQNVSRSHIKVTKHNGNIQSIDIKQFPYSSTGFSATITRREEVCVIQSFYCDNKQNCDKILQAEDTMDSITYRVMASIRECGL